MVAASSCAAEFAGMDWNVYQQNVSSCTKLCVLTIADQGAVLLAALYC
jgi:hypothetical protein